MPGSSPSIESFTGQRLELRVGKDFEPADKQAMFRHVVGFTRELNDNGIAINPAKVIDYCNCFSYIDLANRHDCYISALSTLITSREDIPTFNRVYHTYWDRRLTVEEETREPEKQTKDEEESEQPEDKLQQQQAASEDENDNETSDHLEQEQASYSSSELLLEKDFSRMSEIELENAREILAELLSIIANFKSRRYERSHQHIDLNMRSTIKNSMQYQLDLVKLAYKKQKIKKSRLILLCDVSGSMEHYSRFLIQFIAGLKHQLNNVDVAVFSTRMTDITNQLHSKNLLTTLQEISASVHDWSGGTQIGKCFKEFNQFYAKKMLSSRTTVIVLSDGWDRGDAKLMHDEIALLKRSIDTLIWLNPLLGRQDYEPLCRGIRTALPYIDHFLPAHNLDSLAKLVKKLRKIWNE